MAPRRPPRDAFGRFIKRGASPRPRRPPRDAFGRFIKRGASPRPPPVRGINGRFLSAEQAEARRAEELQRVVDRQFMTPAQRARAEIALARAQEVKQEKRERYARYQETPSAYQWHAKPDKQTLADAALIAQGAVPTPTDVHTYGELTEYIWTWQGHHALQTAQDFLLLARTQLPADSMGYLAMGNGHGKNATWIGTRFGNPEFIWRHSQTFLSSQSANTVEINNLPFGAQDPSIWVEVKLTTKGSVSHVKRNERKRKTVVRARAGTRKKAARGKGKRR